MTSKEYLEKIWDACKFNGFNLRNYYQGERALVLAKEIGCGLADSYSQGESYKSILDEIKGTYSTICVRLYQLRPPVNGKEWSQAMINGFHKYAKELGCELPRKSA